MAKQNCTQTTEYIEKRYSGNDGFVSVDLVSFLLPFPAILEIKTEFALSFKEATFLIAMLFVGAVPAAIFSIPPITTLGGA